MASNQTFDGVRLSRIESLLKLMGADLRDGGKHSKVVKYTGYKWSCAIGPSSHCKYHILPWMREAFKSKYDSDYINRKLKINYA